MAENNDPAISGTPKLEPRRYRVTLWFDASVLGAAERYAAALDRVWEDHAGISSMESQLAVFESKAVILAEPIKRNP